MKLTFRDIVWIAIIALIFVVLSKCHRDHGNKVNADLKALQDKHHNDSIAYKTQIVEQEQKAQASVDKADSIGRINQGLETQLDAKAASVVKLSAELRKFKQPGIDTNFITVDQDYVSYCDSLAYQSSSLAHEYINYKNNNNAIIASLDAAIRSKDTIITIERKAKLNCQNDYNSLLHFSQDFQKGVKPKNQIYIGAELMGNPTHLVNNAGLVVSLKTKSNKLWQLSGGIQTNGQYYARINGNILIKLKP